MNRAPTSGKIVHVGAYLCVRPYVAVPPSHRRADTQVGPYDDIPNEGFADFDLHLVYAPAFRWFRLISSGEPVDVFARAVAGHLKFRSPHVFELDLDGVAAVDRL